MSLSSEINTTLPTEVDECNPSDEEIDRAYNLGLHIGSIFILLGVSFLGAMISVASTRIKRLRINPIIINVGKFFGSGVVLSTAFIHILPDAMENLTDSCLPDSWNIYGAYSGLFAMIAVLAMQLIEFLAHQRVHSSRQKHNHKHIVAHIDLNECAKPDENKQCDDIPPTVNDIQQTVCRDDICVENDNSTNEKRLNIVIDNVPKVKHNHRGKKQSQVHIAEQTKGDDIDNHEGKQSEVKTKPTEIDESKRKHNDCVTIDVIQIQQPPEPAEIFPESGHFHGAAFQDDNQQHKITTYLLELGIALHSVLIGLTLGTTTESFVALLIALCFHQFFEAIALGAQIAYLPTTSMKPLIYMVVFFSLTTPIGIAIGIGIHSGTYNPKAVSSLLVSGILESLSGGVLIYIALVNLISAEMGSNAHGFFSLSTKLKVLYFISLYLGAGAMAVIGRWA